MSIMFCDLVGSTALAARLDPEDLRDVLTAYQKHATAIVEEAGGVVARYQGDGVLVYFGHPLAREDDAERAIGAGLDLARGFGPGDDLREKLSVRVGIATGIVLVGEMLPSKAADSHPVTGEAANLAARLQELAGPNEVVICDKTQRLAGGLFDYRNLGLQRAKGLAEPLQAWQVAGRSKAANRFQALRSLGQSCIGREGEIDLLLQHWASAREGNGRVVVLSGEAGIGKSRLAFELLARVRADQARVVQYDCSPQHQSSVLYPFLERLRRTTLPALDDTGATLARLQEFLPGTHEQAGAAIGMLAELLALRTNAPPASELEGDAKRKRTLLFEAVVRKLLGEAGEQPVLIVVEDAHWVDPTSQELMNFCVNSIKEHRVLLLVTCRPGYDPGWQNLDHASTIALRPISTSKAELLVKHLPGAQQLPEPTVKAIASRADGIPLYLEELTKAAIDGTIGGETAGTAVTAIPASLHASLTARLDRLGPAREVASIAAAIGRDVAFDRLLAVLPDAAPGALRQALGVLVDAGVLSAEEPATDSYEFRHALIQDAAYALLPRDRRRFLHQRIATVLEEGFPEFVALQPEVVATHFAKAGLSAPAVRYWTEAGMRAVRGSALLEAAKHFSEAIALVRTMSASPEREQAELNLQLLLGPVMTAVKGYASSEALEVFARARELAGSSSTTAQQLEILAGLFNVHYGRAELEQASAIAHQHFALAQESGLETARAYCYLGQIDLVQGAFASAQTSFEQVLAIFREAPEDPRTLGVYGSQHVVAQAFLAGVYWALGQPERAVQSTAGSLEYATSSGHLVSIALALITRLLTPIPGGIKGDPAEAESALQFCEHHGLSNFAAWARFAQGAIMVRRGEVREGIDVMQSAIDAAENMGSRLFRPVQLATMASGYARLNEPEKALTLVDEAIALANRTGERRANSALHRLRGELMVALGNPKEGKREFMRAIEIARAQQAVSEIERTQKTIDKLVGVAPASKGGWRRPLAALRSLFRA